MVSHFIFKCSISLAWRLRHIFSLFIPKCPIGDVSFPRRFASAALSNLFPNLEIRLLNRFPKWSVELFTVHFLSSINALNF